MGKEAERNFREGQEVYVDHNGGQYKAIVVSIEKGYIFGFSEGSKKQLDTTGPVAVLPPDPREKSSGVNLLSSSGRLRLQTGRLLN